MANGTEMLKILTDEPVAVRTVKSLFGIHITTAREGIVRHTVLERRITCAADHVDAFEKGDILLDFERHPGELIWQISQIASGSVMVQWVVGQLLPRPLGGRWQDAVEKGLLVHGSLGCE